MASKKPTKPRAKKAANTGHQKDCQSLKADSLITAIPAPFPTTATKEGRKDAGSLDTADGSTTSPTQQPSPAAFPTATREGIEGSNALDTVDGSTTTATQIPDSKTENETGDVAVCSAVAESPVVYSPLAHEETRAQASNRWILEGRRWETERFRTDLIRQCRASGMTKDEAREHAWTACLAQFPPPDVEASAVELPEHEFVAIPESVFPASFSPTPIPSDQGVPGLGTIPESWGTLPANASLQSEISWVSANRLRVRDGSGVDLSRSLSPAPSYSALSWLETSILFPSKFADISVKATQNQEDEAQHVRREKLAIEEIRSLLAEMMEE